MDDRGDDTGPKPRYRWRETWAGEGHEDYQAWDGNRAFGRIMLETNGPMKRRWRWSISYIDGVRINLTAPHNGWQTSPRSAAAMVEDYYERLMEANGMPLNEPPENRE